MYGFSENDVTFCHNVAFPTLTTVKLGGICKTVAYPKNEKSFVALLSYLDKRNLPYRVVGCLSNALPPDGIYKKLLISTRKMRDFSFDRDRVTVSSGARALTVVREGIKLGVSALADVAGIPGTVGGGIRGNAGAFGSSYSDTFISATLYDKETGRRFTVCPSDMDFGYRKSVLKERPFILVNATFQTIPADRECVEEKIRSNLQRRKSSQPHGVPSLGSVFLKNESGESTSYFVDRAGLKGKSVGGVRVSEKHAGFIVNTDGGTAEEYKELIGIIQKEIKARYGFTPCLEIEFL